MASVKVGPTTVVGGTVTLAAYAVAIVAFINGARDEQTISALIVGTLSLLTVLGGRYAQAIVAILALKPAAPAARKMSVPSEQEIASWKPAGTASTSPRPMVEFTNEVPGGGIPAETAS